MGGGCYVGSNGQERFTEVVTFELGVQGYIGICQVEKKKKNTKNSPGRGNSTPKTKRYARVYSMETMVKY